MKTKWEQNLKNTSLAVAEYESRNRHKGHVCISHDVNFILVKFLSRLNNNSFIYPLFCYELVTLVE